MSLPSLETSRIDRLEPTQKWIRGSIGGRTVVDSRRAQLVRIRAPPILRSYAFPPEDVSDAVPDAVRTEVEGHIAIEWDAMDHWYEESEEVFVHPRDPQKRIDALTSSRHVIIEIDGARIAESRRPILLFEDPLPVRYYLPHDDIDMTQLRPNPKTTACPYKGTANYHDVRGRDGWREAIAWSYREPLREVEPIRGLIAFYTEQVDMTVDGERLARPQSPFA